MKSDQTKIGLKALVIGVLTLLFLVPLLMIGGLNDDRKYQANIAAEQVAQSWGQSLTMGSPLLMIPYNYSLKDEKGKWTKEIGKLFWVAEKTTIKLEIFSEIRKKGIFSIPLFRSDLKMNATFKQPDLRDYGIDAQDVLWEQAQLVLYVGSLSSFTQTPSLEWNRKSLELRTTASSPLFNGPFLITSYKNLSWEQGRAEVSISTSQKGSSQLMILPWALETQVSVTSDWPSPSFSGSALPDVRNLSEEGFSAHWSKTGFAQVIQEGEVTSQSSPDTFGVQFFQALDHYQLSHRAIQYGILLIVLPFVALFLLEMITKSPIHPIQYVLIGLANCIFYPLLLSISEHWSFLGAYWTAAGAVVILVSWYCTQIVKPGRNGLIILPLLGLMYAFMNLALQSEDYALLIGSLGLFVLIAVVMLITKKINWYGSVDHTTKEP